MQSEMINMTMNGKGNGKGKVWAMMAMWPESVSPS
jgi:hypothetical protein